MSSHVLDKFTVISSFLVIRLLRGPSVAASLCIIAYLADISVFQGKKEGSPNDSEPDQVTTHQYLATASLAWTHPPFFVLNRSSEKNIGNGE
jgi:hypothetical protein